MFDILAAVVRSLFGALGLLSLLVLGAAVVYGADGLWQRRRYFTLLVLLSATAAAFSYHGVWLVALACSVVVTTQALYYLHFTRRTVMRRSRVVKTTARDALPRVAILIPAKNESAVIEETLRALARVDYPADRLDIVLIDDGSTDEMPALAAALAPCMRHPFRIVRHAESGGKAHRLNELLAQIDHEYALILDADHVVDPDIIHRLLAGFDQGTDVACVQIASGIRNASANVLTKLVEMEYLFRCRGIYPGKPLGMFYGSGGMFRRATLTAVGGFDPAMLTEDVEVSYRLYKNGWRIVYDDSASTYDLAPTTFKSFFIQRHRWMRGLWQAMLLHLRNDAAGNTYRRVRRYFVQFTLDGFGALCLCVLQMYFFLDLVGAIEFHLTAPAYLLLTSCAVAFSVGCIRGRRPKNLLFLPLVPLYIVVHTIPMAWALVDNYVLGKAFLWIKTERAAPSIPVAAPRAASEMLSAGEGS